MQALKIAIISHIRYPIKEPFVGGLECFTHMLAAGLTRRGHDVTLCAAKYSSTSAKLKAIADPTDNSFKQPSVPTYEIAPPELTMFREYCAYNQLLAELAQSDFQIIHNNSLHHLVLDFCQTLPMPMVTTLHTPPLAWLAAAFACRKAKNNFIVSISKYMQRLWSPIIASDAIILNGIDLKRFSYNAARKAEPKKENYSIWFGRITPEKGTHLAIQAAQQANIPIRIAGAIYDSQYFDEAIRPLLNEQSIYIGHLNHQELSTAIKRARLSLCTPCWDEPYGLVAAESLACGTPVAAFNRGAISEILDKKSGTLAQENTAPALAIAIKSALSLEPRNARARAQEVASLEDMLDKYEQLYSRILEA